MVAARLQMVLVWPLELCVMVMIEMWPGLQCLEFAMVNKAPKKRMLGRGQIILVCCVGARDQHTMSSSIALHILFFETRSFTESRNHQFSKTAGKQVQDSSCPSVPC